jgi:16S rRNA C967 or C1407 C5-methylase (RsmB/RsmF family)/NOL1/NOP2/fmu family ribosome biogenesis protein
VELPAALLDSLTAVEGFDRDAFLRVHESGEQVTSIRLNPLKPVAHQLPVSDKIPWSSQGYYLSGRPSFVFDPLWHAGAYYVQEASSMFLELALKQTTDLSQPLRILDLCAAPGGKSTLIQSLISRDSVLVSNEVIKSRAAILEENITRWGGANVIITNNDPQDFSRLENFFDVVVIDAPCSGSGLFRRDPDAISEWSEQHVDLCCQRQHRILADVWPALKQGGVLIYSTCSYSQKENEEVLDWIIDQFSATPLPLLLDADWHIVSVQSATHQAPGYRFFPYKVKGEGFFIACLRKNDGGIANIRPPKKSLLQKPAKQELAVAESWLKPEHNMQIWKQSDRLLAFPASQTESLLAVAEKLYVRSAGVGIGKIAGDSLIPDHALALSMLVSDKIVTVQLKQPEALQYLRKEEVSVESKHKGWALIQHEGIGLGWVKMLGNRVNNYYPSNWRILKGGH